MPKPEDGADGELQERIESLEREREALLARLTALEAERDIYIKAVMSMIPPDRSVTAEEIREMDESPSTFGDLIRELGDMGSP